MQKDELRAAIEAADATNNVYIKLDAKLDAIGRYLLELEAGAGTDTADDEEALRLRVKALEDAAAEAEPTEEQAEQYLEDFRERVGEVVDAKTANLYAHIDEIRSFLNLGVGQFAATPPDAGTTQAEPPNDLLCLIEGCEKSVAGAGYKTMAGLVTHAKDKHGMRVVVADGGYTFVQDVEG